jgi:hypothetical protein
MQSEFPITSPRYLPSLTIEKLFKQALLTPPIPETIESGGHDRASLDLHLDGCHWHA